MMAFFFNRNKPGVLGNFPNNQKEKLLLEEAARQEAERKKKFKKTFGTKTLLERMEESIGE